MDLFTVIPENFFSLLATKNKSLYVACIFQVFKAYEQSSIMGIDKKIVVDDLADFLDKYFALSDTENTYEDDDEEENGAFDKTRTREIANHVLRKMEKTGWVFIDVDNDYQETLNFTSHAITMVETLLSIKQTSIGKEDDKFDAYDPEEFHAFVFTIYSLLTNARKNDSFMVLSEALKNTKLLVRFLRKIDFRLKEYITSVVDTNEIKDLMDRLIRYKTEIFDEAYNKMKINDNVNRYRLIIIQNLEKMLEDEEAMQIIIDGYTKQLSNKDEAIKQAFKDVNEIVDTFNTLDDAISEIDVKIKTYVNATIGKVKFLLNEEDNIIGKLNLMLRHLKASASDDKKFNKAIDLVTSTTTLRQIKAYSKKGLYSGRGNYIAPSQQPLDTSNVEDFVLGAAEIFKTTTSIYSEEAIRQFMSDKIVEKNTDEIVAGDLIHFNSTDEEILTLVHAVIYSAQNGYKIHKRDDLINHNKFLMINFTFRKEE